MDAAANTAMEFRPPLKMRMWRALGFKYSAYAPRPEGDDDSVHYTISRVVAHWDWRDRLRILVSGMTEIEICVETEHLETVKGSRSAAVVLAPGAFFPSGVRKSTL